MNKNNQFFSKVAKFMRKDGVKTVITSLWCALLGLILGFIILLCINPQNAGLGILNTLKNFFVFSTPDARMKFFGQTLAKTAPLIVMSLSITFSYKAGLFNIGASGQYSVAAIIITIAGLAWKLPWWLVIILGMLFGAIWGSLTGILKAYFNVSEVISGIMLNWIGLYMTNAILTRNTTVWDPSHSRAFMITKGMNAFLPNLGLDNIFGGNEIVGIGILFAILAVIIIYVVLNKTTFGFELKATGFNRDAAKYAGMKENKNIILTTAISGALTGLAASLCIQNGFISWQTSSTVPTMGFDGISAAFLGGLNPIGVIFSSYFITHIQDGGSMITDIGYAPQVANIITASIIYLSGFVAFVKELLSKKETAIDNASFRRTQQLEKKEEK